MNNILLRIKNWQLFLLSICLPLVVSALLKKSFNVKIFDSLGIIYYLIMILWNINVVRFFNKDLSFLSKQQYNQLKILLPFSLLFILFSTLLKNLELQSPIFAILSFIFILITAYSFFFLIFCTAKTLKGLQLGDKLRLSDIIVEMFIILYFMIGLWWLQKKVNRYYIEKI